MRTGSLAAVGFGGIVAIAASFAIADSDVGPTAAPPPSASAVPSVSASSDDVPTHAAGPPSATIPNPTTASPAPTSAAAPPVRAADVPTKPAWPTVVLAGVGVVALGLGIGLNVEAAEGLLPENRKGESLTDAVASYNRLDAGGVASFVVGGASLLGMVVYVLWPAPARQAPPVIALPWGAPGAGGVTFAGRF